MFKEKKSESIILWGKIPNTPLAQYYFSSPKIVHLT